MIESVIALPVFVLLIIGIVDMTLLLRDYALISRAVYEGVRYGAGMASVTPGVVRTPVELSDNISHQNIISRAQQILLQTGLNERTRAISSQLCKRINPREVSRVISVEIEYEYFPIFLSFWKAGIPIRINDDGPYLFRVDEKDLPECA